jgi:hypothetical protein
MFRLTHSFSPTLVAATFLGVVVLAGPIHAVAAPATSTESPANPHDGIDKRIQDLHDKIHVTAAQEPKWSLVAQAMRDNAKTMDGLIKERAAHAKTMTAMDDLHSYEQLTIAHENGLKTFIPLFQALYDDLSDAQKKSVDAAFRSHGSRHRKG